MTSSASRPRHRTLRLLTALAAVLLVTLTPAGTARAATGWAWPVLPAEVVDAFDPPAHPWGSGHRGVDLAASIGQTVHAAATGTVTFAGVIAGRGVVVVSHGAIRTTYEPVDAAVTVGTSVAGGDAVGVLQAFAHHCSSPCLHWGAIHGDTYLDPTSLVVPRPSRLLPVWGDGLRLGTETPAGDDETWAADPDATAALHAAGPSAEPARPPDPADWAATGRASAVRAIPPPVTAATAPGTEAAAATATPDATGSIHTTGIAGIATLLVVTVAAARVAQRDTRRRPGGSIRVS